MAAGRGTGGGREVAALAALFLAAVEPAALALVPVAFPTAVLQAVAVPPAAVLVSPPVPASWPRGGENVSMESCL